MAQIFVFGNSIAYGCWDQEGGWVHRLRKFLDKRSFSQYQTKHLPRDMDLVYPLGHSGETSKELRARFKPEIETKVIKTRETVIVFQIGINDSRFFSSESHPETTPKEFSQNIQVLAAQAKQFSSKVIFLGLTPVDESRVTPTPWDKNQFYKNKRVKEFNQIIRSVSEKNGIYFIEIFEKLKSGTHQFLEDGLHPNSKGHQKIFEITRDFSLKNQII